MIAHHRLVSLERVIERRISSLMVLRAGRDRTDRELALVLRVMAAAVRTGGGVADGFDRAATRVSGTMRTACDTARGDLAVGRGVESTVDRFAATLGHPSAQLFAQVVRVQHRRGGSLAAPCHRLATMLHERIRLDAEARTATAQARFSARAVVLIPFLLAALAAWRSPEVALRLVQPPTVFLVIPGIVLIIVGVVVAARVAKRAASASAGTLVAGDSLLARGLRRVGSSAAPVRAGMRIAGVAALLGLPFVVSAGFRPVSVVAYLTALALGGIWPWLDANRQTDRHRAVAHSGLDMLLEVSIALFAAGATAHEVARLAPSAAPEPLRGSLLPAVHRMDLGRSIASAYAGVPEIAASPQLDGWLHAICMSAELGVPATTALEGLLRDARAARREELRAAAQTAGPRMQLAIVLLVVPGVMWIMLLATVGGLMGQLQGSGVL